MIALIGTIGCTGPSLSGGTGKVPEDVSRIVVVVSPHPQPASWHGWPQNSKPCMLRFWGAPVQLPIGVCQTLILGLSQPDLPMEGFGISESPGLADPSE